MTGETYRDPAASIADRAADLLGRMTIDEKVAQLGAIWAVQLVPGGRFDEAVAAGCWPTERPGDADRRVERPPAAESAGLFDQIQRVAVEHTRLGIPVLLHEEAVGGFCTAGATVVPAGHRPGRDLGSLSSSRSSPRSIREQMLAVGARLALAPVLDVARDPAGVGSRRPTASRRSCVHASASPTCAACSRRPAAVASRARRSTSSPTAASIGGRNRRRSTSARASCARSSRCRSPRAIRDAEAGRGS